jgi:hypothetical protein
MSNLLEELKESISETQHTIIKLSREDCNKVGYDLCMHIWNDVYITTPSYTTKARIIVCREDEIQYLVKQCENPTTFFIIEEN